MSNSILGGNISNSNNMLNPNMMSQIKQFAKSLKGDPKAQVMNMVQQGVRTSDQLQQAMNVARQFQGMFK